MNFSRIAVFFLIQGARAVSESANIHAKDDALANKVGLRLKAVL